MGGRAFGGWELLSEAAAELRIGFAGLPCLEDIDASFDAEALRPVLMEVARRLRDNDPYFHPYYAGQMLKPPHPIARLAYALAQLVNPNNHALDGGRASSAMEREAVAELARMVGWTSHLGHLTGGGTMANLEALWVAGQLRPGGWVLASEQAHYTHGRISEVLGLRFRAVPCDARGRLDLAALDDILAELEGEVGLVVATLGTTGLGAVDPLPALIERRQRGLIPRVHADAAYGGYFRLASNLEASASVAFAALRDADSIVIDPHKHGLQPYGCGCVLFRDPSVGRFYKHDSPYTYFSSAELHLGEISLECSRAGAAAVALWATMRHLPLRLGGAFARGLERCREAAIELARRIEADPELMLLLPPELDIVVWAPRAASASAVSEASRSAFRRQAERGVHLALIQLPGALVAQRWPELELDAPRVTALRSCLMKPEHRDWLDRLKLTAPPKEPT